MGLGATIWRSASGRPRELRGVAWPREALGGPVGGPLHLAPGGARRTRPSGSARPRPGSALQDVPSGNQQASTRRGCGSALGRQVSAEAACDSPHTPTPPRLGTQNSPVSRDFLPVELTSARPLTSADLFLFIFLPALPRAPCPPPPPPVVK